MISLTFLISAEYPSENEKGATLINEMVSPSMASQTISDFADGVLNVNEPPLTPVLVNDPLKEAEVLKLEFASAPTFQEIYFLHTRL